MQIIHIIFYSYNYWKKSINNTFLYDILNQAKKSIYNIKTDSNKVGVGFLCIIPFPKRFNIFTVFISDNMSLNKDDISNGKAFTISNVTQKKCAILY